jgi:hypothetical protein
VVGLLTRHLKIVAIRFEKRGRQDEGEALVAIAAGVTFDQPVSKDRDLGGERGVRLDGAEAFLRTGECRLDDLQSALVQGCRGRKAKIAHLGGLFARRVDDEARLLEAEVVGAQLLRRRRASLCLRTARRPAARGSKERSERPGAVENVGHEALTVTVARTPSVTVFFVGFVMSIALMSVPPLRELFTHIELSGCNIVRIRTRPLALQGSFTVSAVG